MQAVQKQLMDLEKRFWQSMVEEDTDTALSLLDESSMLVSPHGAMQFTHDDYRRMAEKSDMVIKAYELSDMKVAFPTEDTAILTYRAKQRIAKRGQSKEIRQEMTDASVWAMKGGGWKCVMHTETPVDGKG